MTTPPAPPVPDPPATGRRAVLSVTVDRPATPGARLPTGAALARIERALATSGGALGARPDPGACASGPPLVVRIGDTGVVALLPVADAADARRVAEAVRGSVAGLTAGPHEDVTVSVGVAITSGAGLWDADNALYTACRTGGDAVRVAGG